MFTGSHSITVEEQDAQLIFEQLNWETLDKNVLSPSELQIYLGKQADSLNMEIMDFLLHWEQDELQSQFKSRSISSFQSSNSEARKLKDTSELLNEISKIDQELGLVDKWLDVQIGRLSGVQSELQQIEVENGSLEASWHNLSSLKTMASYLVDTLCLSPNEEDLLKTADRIIEHVLRLRSLDDVEEKIKDLLDAGKRLLTGLSVRGVPTKQGTTIVTAGAGEKNRFQLTDVQWAQLQVMMSVSQQRMRLISHAEAYCKAFVHVGATMFKLLLKHKDLNDPFQPNNSILVKSVNVTDILNQLSASYKSSSRFMTPFPRSFPNPLLQAQNVYQKALGPFIPAIEHFIELLPHCPAAVAVLLESKQSIHLNYVEATRDLLYRPIFKQLFKDTSTLIFARSSHHITLGNVPKYTLDAENDHNYGEHYLNSVYGDDVGVNAATSGLSPAVALSLLFRYCEPLLMREEAFMQV